MVRVSTLPLCVKKLCKLSVLVKTKVKVTGCRGSTVTVQPSLCVSIRFIIKQVLQKEPAQTTIILNLNKPRKLRKLNCPTKSKVWPLKWKLSISIFQWYCSCCCWTQFMFLQMPCLIWTEKHGSERVLKRCNAGSDNTQILGLNFNFLTHNQIMSVSGNLIT